MWCRSRWTRRTQPLSMPAHPVRACSRAATADRPGPPATPPTRTTAARCTCPISGSVRSCSIPPTVPSCTLARALASTAARTVARTGAKPTTARWPTSTRWCSTRPRRRPSSPATTTACSATATRLTPTVFSTGPSPCWVCIFRLVPRPKSPAASACGITPQPTSFLARSTGCCMSMVRHSVACAVGSLASFLEAATAAGF